MNTRNLPPAAIGCAGLFLIALVCSLTVFASQRETAFGPCQNVDPPAFSLEEAHALRQQVLDTFMSGRTGPFRLDVSSTAINSAILWATEGTPVYKPAVWFAPGRVCLRGTLELLGPLRLDLSAAMTARLAGDQVRLDVEYLRLGRWVLPGAARRYLADIANETIQDARPPIQFTEVSLVDGHLTIAGIRRPTPSVSWRQILPQLGLLCPTVL
jgi:hypothetical protein